MTVWVLHQELTAPEEARIHERTHLTLPFDGLPDFTMVHSLKEFMDLLRALHPQEPPESLTLRFDRLWRQYNELQEEDIIAVPLPHSGKVALARVAGKYCYQVDDNRDDVHLIPVEWYPNIETLRSFWREKDIFIRTGSPLYAVNRASARKAILGRLPYKYNRLSRTKVVWAFIFMLMLSRLYIRLVHSQ